MVPRAIRPEKNKRDIQGGKKEVNLSLFTDDLILYVENHKDYGRNLELINEFSKAPENKINTQKSVIFLCTTSEQFGKGIKKTIPFTIATKGIQYLGISQADERLLQ